LAGEESVRVRIMRYFRSGTAMRLGTHCHREQARRSADLLVRVEAGAFCRPKNLRTALKTLDRLVLYDF
jgi:hypothetical protein